VLGRWVFDRNSERPMIKPIIEIKSPETKATKPGPGSRKVPIFDFQARRQMRTPMPIQKNPSTFLICFKSMGPYGYRVIPTL